MNFLTPACTEPVLPSFYTIERVADLLNLLNAALAHLAAQSVDVRLVELEDQGYGAAVTEPGSEEILVTASRHRV